MNAVELREGMAVVTATTPSISVVRSSSDLRWSGIEADEQLVGGPSGRHVSDGPDHHLVCFHLTPAAFLAHRSEGRRDEGRYDRGEFGVFPARTPYEAEWAETFSVVRLRLAPAFISKVALEAGDFDPGKVELRGCFRTRDPMVEAIVLGLMTELDSPGLGGRLYAESMANLLSVYLLRHHADAAPASVGQALSRGRLKKVTDFIHDNLAADLCLADLAALAHLSEYHFARLFKQMTGQPPHQFVIHQRIERAKELIRDGRLTLAEIAAAVGFTDQSHFTRQFKLVVGVTPKQFC